MDSIDYLRYLKSKESVDRRSLSSHVYNRLFSLLKEMYSKEGTINVLDVGAGLGSSFKRLLPGIPTPSIDYTVIDIEPSHVEVAEQEITLWLKDEGYSIEKRGASVVGKCGEQTVELKFVTGDALAYGRRHTDAFDLIVGQAFLDILPLDDALNSLFNALRPGGLYYFPITYDGLTTLVPVLDDAFDAEIAHQFNRSMDTRKDGTTAGSTAGRQLLTRLPAAGARIEAVGSSDWIVRPNTRSTGYPDDEAYFLQCILSLMYKEACKADTIPQAKLDKWYDARRMQLQYAGLSYIAHQLDYVGRFLG